MKRSEERYNFLQCDTLKLTMSKSIEIEVEIEVKIDVNIVINIIKSKAKESSIIFQYRFLVSKHNDNPYIKSLKPISIPKAFLILR